MAEVSLGVRPDVSGGHCLRYFLAPSYFNLSVVTGGCLGNKRRVIRAYSDESWQPGGTLLSVIMHVAQSACMQPTLAQRWHRARPPTLPPPHSLLNL
ncbi:hypothetical protein SRHO_G00293300 [Serrasalmus rhombeus]